MRSFVYPWLLLWSVSTGAACPVSYVGESGGYRSISEALASVHQAISAESVSADTEFVGTVRHTASGYTISTYRGCAGEDAFALRLPATRGLLAVWHTHGAPGFMRDWFSAEDAELVRTLRVPMVLLLPGGEARLLSVREASRSRRASLARRVAYRGRALPVR